MIEPRIYFSEHFGVSAETLAAYGAFDICIVSDLPMFIDPFLLFTSEKPEYQALHQQIVIYLQFLQKKSGSELSTGDIKNWYHFKEVKQNWLGFTVFGNGGHALGETFAKSLNSSLGDILRNVGKEEVVGTHLEKLAIIGPRVGRDCVSDFTTNLIKHYLLRYTEKFARDHMREEDCSSFSVPRAAFNYETETWETRTYFLPELRDDFVILTPVDMLTRDDTWISREDLLRRFKGLPAAVEDDQTRAQLNNYFSRVFYKKQTIRDRNAAIDRVIKEFPELVDLYIGLKEEEGEEAKASSREKTDDTHEVLVRQVKLAVPDLQGKTDFYGRPWTSYDEALERVLCFKDYIENKDGYRVINRAGRPFSQEVEVQLFFGLIWCYTDFDVNREPNNGRGPVDFKVSYGSGDKSLIEFKLASNSSLKRNLEKQVSIYEAANGTRQSVKVILCYTAEDQEKTARVLTELDIRNEPSIVVIDARSDNKPSASKA
ncbi:hypothetical protein [Streptomyces netropsis]|uniref:Uncharacterized protein n=1 Tax=Streptomyces netropsis TaxID=55404 RepID=A0A7W7LGC9_STRNE|nr:hypothetical protein [Streptomyces netropsis]MBB4889763.1 hypothetical protein [Streptomyces netropsis]GGR40952.1 hypothetical protein GCM10010219_52660 [Streptomyces netropsis]